MAKKETSTKSFVLRVDAATMDAIEKWAADEFRSTNGQLQWIIAEALRVTRYAAIAMESDLLRFAEISFAHQQSCGTTYPDIALGIRSYEARAVTLGNGVVF